MSPSINPLGELLEFWNTLLFIPQPSLTLCVFRLLTGLLVLSETYSWLGVYKNLLSPEGWFGYDDYERTLKKFRFSLLNYLPVTSDSIKWVLGVQFVAGLFLTAGVLPQLAAFICFVTLVSLHNRNIYVLSSGDTVYRFFCLFLIFAPSGHQLSVLYPTTFLNPDATAWPWTLILVRLFMANIYLKNVLFKLLGESWRDGNATQKVLRVSIWNRKKLPSLLDHPWFYKTTTYGTLVVETALFTLIWFEDLRLGVVAAGILFHLGLWYFLRLGFFQAAMIVGLMVFVKPEEFTYFFRWLAHLVA
jgi:hypothetical protein